ncbi:MAG TPA: prolipoprotein diacylglyceryl transferase family protein [Streptosporangiaceae bacterium]
MPIAYIPSPSHGVWQLGPVPIRGYALCLVAGVIVAVWLADRRYRAAGGQRRVMVDVATWAVPLGLIGARAYSVLTDYQLYFGRRDDWVTMVKIWDGGIGMPGGLALGFLGAWIACRRAGLPVGQVAGAAAPAIAIGQAIGSCSSWFNQQLYGRPSTLPWALEIGPSHRLTGYESFVTFQPAFLYQVLWDLLTAAVVIWAARRFAPTGDRVFALYLAVYAVGMFVVQTVLIDYSHHLLGLRTNEWVALLAFGGAAWYLYRTRHAHPAGRPAAAYGAVSRVS